MMDSPEEIQKRLDETPLIRERTVTELSPQDQILLITTAESAGAKILFRIMEQEIIDARDEAMAVNPAKEAEQRAAMTVAHAMAKFYRKVRTRIQQEFQKHKESLIQAQQSVLDDPEEVEEMILSQALALAPMPMPPTRLL